jgi:GT2 family glycosyltransferase
MAVQLEPGVPRPHWYGPLWDDEPAGLMPSSMLIRREVFDMVGPFDPRFEVGEDTDWILRGRELGVTVGQLSDVLFIYRIHATNSMHHRALHRDATFRLLKASVDRKRAREST